MSDKFYDPICALQIIGCVLIEPSLLSQSGEYFFNETDFPNELHRTVFGTLYNLYNMGTERLTSKVILDYLENREKSKGIFNTNGGIEWLERLRDNADLTTFKYYYDRLKKMTLLREYEKAGVNLDWLYDPDEILDIDKKQDQMNFIDELSLEDIANKIDDKILSVRESCVDNSSYTSKLLGETVEETLERIKSEPIIGARMFDDYTNSICMGARRGKLYIRSAATGIGKSRTMMADACQLSCEKFWNLEEHKWEKTFHKEQTLFISVELDEEELQTMAIAFISGVSEDKVIGITDSNFEEQERIVEAISILKKAPLYFQFFPNYGLVDVENCIKRNIRQHKVKYVFFDYITSSMKMISDLAKQSKGMALREDQVLFQLASKLKDIAGIYNIFILSATQLNASYKVDKIPNESLLAGAKAIANRVDVGMIMLNVTPEEKEQLEPICNEYGLPIPNVKMSIYKNRRGKYTNVLLWMVADKGICRYKTVFMTDFGMEMLSPPENLKVKMV